MKSFPYSPRTTRHSTGSMIRAENSGVTNLRALSPSMPNSGHVSSIKSSWENRTQAVGATRNTARKALNRNSSSSDQENVRDGNNKDSLRPMRHEDKVKSKQPTRIATKKIKDDAWVRKTDTDDTTSLSSHSNNNCDNPIEKSSSNVSDVSAPSTSSSHWRYKHVSNARKVDVNSYAGIESYTSFSTTGSSHSGGTLASKLASEKNGLKNISSSDEETSTLNYSLEKLPEDAEEETYSRSSKYDTESAKKSASMNLSGIEAKLTKDRATLEQEDTLELISSSSTAGLGDSLEAYVELSSRLTQKISTVPSTDSSLVYSEANTDEPSYDLKKYAHDNPYSYDSREDPDPSDLVASTLAECRLLLGMSPPPTPVYATASPVRREKKNIRVSTVMSPKPPRGGNPSAAAPSPDNSIASLGLTKFLKCPCCQKEFTNDNEKSHNRQPLHSFACDHIVCYECVFSDCSPLLTMVPCPQCGVARAFNTVRPVVSRSYCSLVKSIEIMNSAKKGSGEKTKLRQERDECRDDDIGRDGAVPSQIRLFSPSSDVPVASDSISVEETRENRLKAVGNSNDSNRYDESESTTNTFSPFSGEPDTPVSRAEFRFLQRKEKLAQSLEKVNRLLERSKMNRDEVSLTKVEECVTEMKEENGGVEGDLSHHTYEAGISDCKDEAEVAPRNDEDAEKLFEVFSDSLRVDGDIFSSVINDKSACGTLWTDEGLHLSPPQETSIVKRIKPELRVDTGNYTPHAHHKNPFLNLKDESTLSFESEIQHRSREDRNKNNETTTSINDIFRSGTISPPKVFGTLGNGTLSQESSLTDRDSDNQFLLGDSASIKSGMGSLKEKKYGLHKSPLKDTKALSADKPRREQKLTEEHRCPQFLPSLTYSTMQDSDELVGLVKETESPMATRAAISRMRFSHGATPNKIFPQWKNPKGMRLSFGKTESYDEGGYGDLSNYEKIEKVESFATQDDDRHLLKGHSYVFAQHSCSFSPSATDSRSLRGALVTHKPKFHKRVLSKFAFKGKKQTYFGK
ncbi:hypothetical protein ACHAWX_006223 [Stephanocyclus meneghinianus]